MLSSIVHDCKVKDIIEATEKEKELFLIKKGFMMLQESVYCKLALNQTIANSIVESVKNNKPTDGLVLLLSVTEKQFSKMEYICGEKKSSIIDSDERLIIL